MEADDRQVMTVQPSFHPSALDKTVYHERYHCPENGVLFLFSALSANDEVRCDCMFADDGNAS